MDQLVEFYMPHIRSVARLYRNNRAVERNELIQDGVVGLLRALERYDTSRATPFWPYAVWWVRQAMQHLVAEMTRQVVLSDRALRRLSRIKDARAAWLRTQSREPTLRELTELCGCRREDIERLLASELPARGLEEPAGGRDRAGSPLCERLADETSGDAYDRVHDTTGVATIRARCALLSERERHIVYAHFGLDGEARTLREIAGDLSLSVERVRQIEEVALQNLRDGFVSSTSRHIDPGGTPRAMREALRRELTAEGCTVGATHGLVSAAHELTVVIWFSGRVPHDVRVGGAVGGIFCEVSDPAAGPAGKLSAAIATRMTSHIDRVGSRRSTTFRLWARTA